MLHLLPPWDLLDPDADHAPDRWFQITLLSLDEDGAASLNGWWIDRAEPPGRGAPSVYLTYEIGTWCVRA